MRIVSGTIGLALRYRDYLYRRSLEVPSFLDRHLVTFAAAWIAVAGFAALVRMSVPAAPIHKVADAMPTLVAYSAVIVSPLAGYVLARAAFGDGSQRKPLTFHLSFLGKWRTIDRDEARANPMFGPVGFMATLIVGLMLNVAVRTGEYFVAIPAMSTHAPGWSLTLFAVMTMDLVVMNFLYMVAFVMALRTIPLFPRMLLLIWLVDILMQLVIANRMAAVSYLPGEVVEPLVGLLQGNIVKVAISMILWLPYMIISRRVNLTYRSRLRV